MLTHPCVDRHDLPPCQCLAHLAETPKARDEREAVARILAEVARG